MPKASVLAQPLDPLAPSLGGGSEAAVIVYLFVPRSTDPLQFVQGLAALRGRRFLYTEAGSQWSVAVELPRRALEEVRRLLGARFLGYGHRYPKARAPARQ